MTTLLPMHGLTHGSRSAVTCHFKCDSACANPVPNQSTEPTFREIASRQLSRRNLLIGTGAIAAAAALPAAFPDPAAAAHTGRLAFTPIPPVEATEDRLVVPQGYQWTTIVRWGDPLFDNSPAFNPLVPDAEAQELQFGYNNDYLDILVTDRAGRRALLVCNHEYTNRTIMFPPTSGEAEELEVIRTLMAAHGMSVVELQRRGRRRPWRYIKDGRRNRRITAHTVFRLDGPAAGSELLKTAADPTGTRVKGTLNNCAGGTTPWGTILSGEENFNGYFVVNPEARGATRYGLGNKRPSSYGFEKVDPRFDATTREYANEPHRFGYIVELDPSDPTSVPRKHTAMGRFKHEGAHIRVDDHNRVAAYMGDDERFDYLYKFVARNRFAPEGTATARRRNLRLLSEGDLYVARFSGVQRPRNDNLGRGVWVPLTQNGESVVPGFSTEEVLVFTRLAADAVKATPMDRPEDVEPHPKTGKVYVACTNNTDRGKPGKPGPDAPNPRGPNRYGHVIEITERDNRADATTFEWNLFLVCGDPADPEAGTYFGGYEGNVTPISCPDNVAFDSEGNLWVATDGAPGSIQKNDALFKVPVSGSDRGKVQQFLSVPIDAETCGPVIKDTDESVFVAVQHPGEDGTWAKQRSFFPDYVPEGRRPARGEWRGPRPSVVQVTRRRSARSSRLS